MPPFIANLIAKPKTLVGLILIPLILLGLIISFFGTRSTVVDHETGLNAKYTDCQNTLSSYTQTIKEALGVANAASAALDTVLTDVVKGRYEAGSTANPGSGSAFSMITEAYPDLSGVTINYGKVQTAIFAGREQFKNCNTGLVDRIREYDAYTGKGILRPMWLTILGQPTDRLEARKGTDILTGQAALKQMKNLPLSSEATTSYDTGIDQGIDTNPVTPTPNTTPTPATVPNPDSTPTPVQ